MPATDERNGRTGREDGIEWRRSAACRDIDPEIFFPDAGPDAERRTARAKAICAGCPVREQCLDIAIERREPAGIWGGTTPGQRLAIRRKRRREQADGAARWEESEDALLLSDRIHRAERGCPRPPVAVGAGTLPAGGERR